ncbi:MAG: ribonuclease H-like domain-containing protein [Candidatus Krumholzibacteriota bacterium]|nr:ribonuclease H-like domain-containing protein [Candidatus Krumholzibacteriota bacterium]
MKEKKINLRNELEALKRKAELTFRSRESFPGPQGYSPPGPDHPLPPLMGGDIFQEVVPDMEGTVREGGGPLEILVPGAPFSCGRGEFYRILVEAGEIWERAAEVLDEYLEILSAPFDTGVKGLEDLGALREILPAEVCYLDIETTGLSNTPLFLVGLMYLRGGRLMSDQLFARDYTEEEFILSFLNQFLSRYKALVTFNGARFDLPFIRERMSFAGFNLDYSGRHIDLLPLSRGLLGGRTPNHKLQTLEIHLLGRKRSGDIPGSRIPRAYHDYVRNGGAGEMARVIHHNRLDLLSMLELVIKYLSLEIQT